MLADITGKEENGWNHVWNHSAGQKAKISMDDNYFILNLCIYVIFVYLCIFYFLFFIFCDKLGLNHQQGIKDDSNQSAASSASPVIAASIPPTFPNPESKAWTFAARGHSLRPGGCCRNQRKFAYDRRNWMRLLSKLVSYNSLWQDSVHYSCLKSSHLCPYLTTAL